VGGASNKGHPVGKFATSGAFAVAVLAWVLASILRRIKLPTDKRPFRRFVFGVALLVLVASSHTAKALEVSTNPAAAPYENAALHGDAASAEKIANLYATGNNPRIPKDLVKARAWYERGAELGSAEAQYQFGIWENEGKGGPVDKPDAIRWLRYLAGRSDADDNHRRVAMYYLRSMQALPSPIGSPQPYPRNPATQFLTVSDELLPLAKLAGVVALVAVLLAFLLRAIKPRTGTRDFWEPTDIKTAVGKRSFWQRFINAWSGTDVVVLAIGALAAWQIGTYPDLTMPVRGAFWFFDALVVGAIIRIDTRGYWRAVWWRLRFLFRGIAGQLGWMFLANVALLVVMFGLGGKPTDHRGDGYELARNFLWMSGWVILFFTGMYWVVIFVGTLAGSITGWKRDENPGREQVEQQQVHGAGRFMTRDEINRAAAGETSLPIGVQEFED